MIAIGNIGIRTELLHRRCYLYSEKPYLLIIVRLTISLTTDERVVSSITHMKSADYGRYVQLKFLESSSIPTSSS